MRGDAAEDVAELVDAVLNLVSASESEIVTLTGLIRDAGVIVTTATQNRADHRRHRADTHRHAPRRHPVPSGLTPVRKASS